MKTAILLPVLVSALTLATLLPATRQTPATVAVAIGDEGLLIDRPRDWRVGILQGPSILLHYVGGADGYPQFTAMSDPEAALPEDASPRRRRAAIEDLFETIAEVGDEVIEAEWVERHGLDVYDTLAVRDSLAGRIQRRRLLLVHRGVPYVLVWAHYADRFEQVRGLIDTCAESLRTGTPPGVVAGLAALPG